MSLNIKCVKCGMNSNNPYDFGNKRISYLDKNNYVVFDHICNPCLEQLNNRILIAEREFLSEEINSVIDFYDEVI